jgi:hypothetical protein
MPTASNLNLKIEEASIPDRVASKAATAINNGAGTAPLHLLKTPVGVQRKETARGLGIDLLFLLTKARFARHSLERL